MAAPSSSDSSCDEENVARLREAVVDSYIIDRKPEKNDKPRLPSLSSKSTQRFRPGTMWFGVAVVLSLFRPSSFEQEEEHALQTTPGFRSHVARKLTQLIDSQLQEVESCCTCPDTNSAQSEGIRLFSKSTKFVAINDDDITQRPNKRKQRRPTSSSSSDDSSGDERLAEASVSFSAIQEMSHIQNYDRKSNSDIITVTGYPEKCDESQDKSCMEMDSISDKSDIQIHKKRKKKKKKQKFDGENKGST